MVCLSKVKERMEVEMLHSVDPSENADLAAPQLELTDIQKYFGVTHVLKGVTIKIQPGEIIGLIGPNGAGKSTLMQIITGVYAPTSGTIKMNGEEIPLKEYNPLMARNNGISCAYQELSMCTNLSVYENFGVYSIGHTVANFFKKENWKDTCRKMSRQLLDSIFPENNINVNSAVENLTLAQQQMVEITRAISFENLKILILDEPTSSISVDRINQLHKAIKKLSENGVSVFYITHKLDEVKRITDKIFILKGGINTWEGLASETTEEELVKNLGGTILKDEREKMQAVSDTEKIVEVTGLTAGHLNNVNMYLKEGEIVGLAGLAGSGQKELLNELFRAGLGHKSPSMKVNRSIAYLSGDRQTEGIFHLNNIADNILVSSLNQVTKWGLISRSRSAKLAGQWYDKLKFQANGIYTPITALSGGNQQKALIARGVASQSDILLLDDPTRGVDIETKQEIYKLLQEARNDGKTVFWHSTEDIEMEECDRVYVMNNRAIVKEFTVDEITVSNIVGAAFQETAQQTNASEERNKGFGGRFKNLLGSRSTTPFLFFIVLLVVNGLINHNSLSYTGIEYTIGAAIPLVFAAIAQMFLIMAGDIDFGLGNGVGLINVLCATFFVKSLGLGLLYCLVFVVCYTLMGVLIHVRRIPSIIVTLGASFIWLGIALLIQNTPGGSCPAWLKSFYEFKFPLIPFPIFFCIVAALIPLWIIKYSKYGIILRGIGNNPKAVTRAGWSYFRAHVICYAIASIFIVISGLTATAVSYGSDANAFSAFTVCAVATVIIGGCDFSGGIGEPIGVVAGALVISMISSLLTFLSLDSNYQTALIGVILILALAVRLFTRKRAK